MSPYQLYIASVSEKGDSLEVLHSPKREAVTVGKSQGLVACAYIASVG